MPGGASRPPRPGVGAIAPTAAGGAFLRSDALRDGAVRTGRWIRWDFAVLAHAGMAKSTTIQRPESQTMKKTMLALGIAAAQMFAVGAFAQGEVGGVKKPPPATAASPQEKAAARAERRTEGAEAVKQNKDGEVGRSKAPPPAAKATPEEKAAARAQRKAEGAEAIRKQPSGEVGPTK